MTISYRRGAGALMAVALGLAWTGAMAAEATIGESEIWRALYPDAPTDPNNPNNTGDASAGVSPENAAARRYHWNYSRTDPQTGLPLQIPQGDERIGEIDGYRIQCVKLINKMYDSNSLPVHIPASRFADLENQSVWMVLGCVNNLYLKRKPWLKGVGAIVCEANTNHCWGPGDIWKARTPAYRH